MKLPILLAVACIGFATVASAQSYTQTEVKGGTVIGEVIRYEPGRVIVIRGADEKEVSYTLTPSIKVPADVQIGRRVTLYTEHGADGATIVSRVVTTSVTPEGNVQRTTEETRTSPSGEVTKTTTISGEVVRYEPGKTIVVRDPSRKVITYALAPNVVMPADVEVGRRVTLYTEPGMAGKTLVSRVVTTSVTSEGKVKQTTEETRTSPSGATTKTTTTTTSAGTVEAYVPGKTITITRADGTRVTYMINEQSQVPADIVIGKTVSIVPLGSSGEPVVRTITIVREQ